MNSHFCCHKRVQLQTSKCCHRQTQQFNDVKGDKEADPQGRWNKDNIPCAVQTSESMIVEWLLTPSIYDIYEGSMQKGPPQNVIESNFTRLASHWKQTHKFANETGQGLLHHSDVDEDMRRSNFEAVVTNKFKYYFMLEPIMALSNLHESTYHS
jgi:hypothetical protein